MGLDEVSSNSESTSDSIDEVLDDATIEVGDAYTRESSGETVTPESDAQIYSIAPAEGQKPISIMTDEHFEEMANPDKVCLGTLL